MRRPRITIGRMMAIVAAFAAALSAWRWHRLASEYDDRAAIFSYYASTCAEAEEKERSAGEGWERSELEFQNARHDSLPSTTAHKGTMLLYSADRHARLGAHFLRLKMKYLRAAARPWFRVEPDPPTPE